MASNCATKEERNIPTHCADVAWHHSKQIPASPRRRWSQDTPVLGLASWPLPLPP